MKNVYAGELAYDRLNGTREIGRSYAKSGIYIRHTLDMHATGTKHVVRHSQKSGVCGPSPASSPVLCIRKGADNKSRGAGIQFIKIVTMYQQFCNNVSMNNLNSSRSIAKRRHEFATMYQSSCFSKLQQSNRRYPTYIQSPLSTTATINRFATPSNDHDNNKITVVNPIHVLVTLYLKPVHQNKYPC